MAYAAQHDDSPAATDAAIAALLDPVALEARLVDARKRRLRALAQRAAGQAAPPVAIAVPKPGAGSITPPLAQRAAGQAPRRSPPPHRSRPPARPGHARSARRSSCPASRSARWRPCSPPSCCCGPRCPRRRRPTSPPPASPRLPRCPRARSRRRCRPCPSATSPPRSSLPASPPWSPSPACVRSPCRASRCSPLPPPPTRPPRPMACVRSPACAPASTCRRGPPPFGSTRCIRSSSTPSPPRPRTWLRRAFPLLRRRSPPSRMPWRPRPPRRSRQATPRFASPRTTARLRPPPRPLRCPADLTTPSSPGSGPPRRLRFAFATRPIGHAVRPGGGSPRCLAASGSADGHSHPSHGIPGAAEPPHRQAPAVDPCERAGQGPCSASGRNRRRRSRHRQPGLERQQTLRRAEERRPQRKRPRRFEIRSRQRARRLAEARGWRQGRRWR